MSAHPAAPVLANQFRTDRVLQTWLRSMLPAGMPESIEADLDALGGIAAEAWGLARARTAAKPILTRWDAWGGRIDRIESTPVWQQGSAIAARYGLVAAGHEAAHGEFARCDQFARVYLHHVASEFHTCPLAMSDGAATALKASGNTDLIARAVPRLTSRDPAQLWLSGQWMTELGGGSDVAQTETEARRDADGQWRLHGRKWFTSAVIGEMALTLARPQGAGPGADALAMFLVETRDVDGRWNGIRIDRLKDKLGTHELPTAEIHLQGALATPVAGIDHGVRLIAPMLNVTRTWNAACALATMRRCLALATAYAHQRQAFGRRLIDHPLHLATLADMQAEFEAAFQLVFQLAHLLGRSETGRAHDGERALLRLLTPLAKLWTGKLAVRIASETCEAFGGAGYIENTGIPQLLRDAQVFPIWEGTTNVLALDTLRAIAGVGIEPLLESAGALLEEAGQHAHAPRSSLAQIHLALERIRESLPRQSEADARGLALSLARTYAAALLARNAARAAADDGPARGMHALQRFVAMGLTDLREVAPEHALDLLDPPSI